MSAPITLPRPPAPPAPPPSLLHGTFTLPSKPTAPLAYSYLPPPPCSPTTSPALSTSAPILIVFINGLGLPKSSWYATITGYLDLLQTSGAPSAIAHPAFLLYDRFGQGETTARDPLDALPGKQPGYGHDMLDAARDLQEVIVHFSAVVAESAGTGSTPADVRIVLVGNSIGCVIARLHAGLNPGTVTGMVMLDSNVANSDQLDDMWPDPDAVGFDAGAALPAGTTVEDLRHARAASARLFGPSTVNGEGLDRRNAKMLLPRADAPELVGRGGGDVLLFVVAHDAEEFARQSEMSPMLAVKRALTGRYAEKAWREYNEGLVRLSGRARGVVVAKGCGHFVQKDGPGFVAGLIREMVEEIGRSV